MKIIVCVKVSNGELNPFDASALECALQLSDDVTVVSMGPKDCASVLLPLTRLGAKAVLISDPLFAGSDTLATAYVLSTALKQMEYDLVLCGRQSTDGDTAQVGPMLAQMLSVPVVTNAMRVRCEDQAVFAETREGEERAALPALVTVERSFILRFPGIFSKLGEVSVTDHSTLGCDASRCGLAGSPTRVLQAFTNESGKRKCRFISMDELIPLAEGLMKEKRSQETAVSDGAKLKSVWAVGEEVRAKAAEIAEEVTVLPKSSPDEIARKARAEKPGVILWNADLWGRKNAPIVAAMLNTGLCADCTHLEADGDELIMYRPAQGGSIYAKIKCLTRPQMATVRTKQESADIVVSGGKGVAGKTEKLRALADTLHAELGASRGLVDLNGAPYEAQIGLTGKTVSPKIYIAIGISGAVQHTCAIEGADTVIAVNPDKNARIFEYADYGIIAEF